MFNEGERQKKEGKEERGEGKREGKQAEMRK